MGKSEAIMAKAAGAFNKVRRYFPDAQRVFLLKRSEHSSVLVSNGELTADYFLEFDDNRAVSGLLRYATTTAAFRDTWAESSHVACGVPDASSKLEVFEFVVDEKDTIDPVGPSPFWSGRFVKLPNERYTIV